MNVSPVFQLYNQYTVTDYKYKTEMHPTYQKTIFVGVANKYRNFLILRKTDFFSLQ